MTGSPKPMVTVYRPVQRQALPLLKRVGRHWRLSGADAAATAAAPAPAESLLDLLCDLAHYGLVLPLAEVRTGELLWWPGQTAPEGELRVPADAGGGEAAPCAPFSCIRWTVTPPADDRWRHGVSAMARWVAASAGLPVVHHELLSLAARIETLPQGDVCLRLGRVSPAAFAWPWRRGSWDAIARRARLLRERRRLALGLPVRHDMAELDDLIERRFVVPMAQRLLDAANLHPQRRLHVLGCQPLARAGTPERVIELPVGRYLSDDPLGENLYVLGGRRIQPASAVGRQLRCTGRGLAALAHRTQQAIDAPVEAPAEWGAAMLAALQLDYLQTHRCPPGPIGEPT